MSVYTKNSSNGQRTHSGHTVDTGGLAIAFDQKVMALTARNNSEDTTVYVHHTNDQSAAVDDGYPIPPGGDFSDSASYGPWYFFTESGTADVRLAIVRRRPRL